MRGAYRAVAAHDTDGWWVATVPALPEVVTQARTLRTLRGRVAEAIAAWLEVDPADVDVQIVPDLDDAVVRALREVAKLRHEADLARQAADEATEDAIELLIGRAGLKLRDTSMMIGLSHQRVAQLAARRRHGSRS